jgi:hypothetical protein
MGSEKVSEEELAMEWERMLDDSTAHTLLSLASGELADNRVYHKADRWRNQWSLRYNLRLRHPRRDCSHNLDYWCMGSEKVSGEELVLD